MIATEAPLSVDSAAEKVLSLLGNDEPEQQVTETVEQTAQPDQPEPAGDVQEVAGEPEAEAAPQEPPIEPPAFWDASAKERFKALGPDLQKIIVEKERERESVFGKTQREAAEARKAAEAERQAVQQERQSYVQRLSQIADSVQTTDPILAKHANTDWVKFAKEDPIAAFQEKQEFDARKAYLTSVTQQRDFIASQIRAEQVRQSEAKLAEHLGEDWTNADKRSAFQSEVRKVLTDAGYAPQDFEGVTDYRALLIARRAAMADKYEAQLKAIADKKVTPTPNKTVLRSQAVDSGDKSDRMKAAIQRASKSSRLDDIAAQIAAALD